MRIDDKSFEFETEYRRYLETLPLTVSGLQRLACSEEYPVFPRTDNIKCWKIIDSMIKSVNLGKNVDEVVRGLSDGKGMSLRVEVLSVYAVYLHGLLDFDSVVEISRRGLDGLKFPGASKLDESGEVDIIMEMLMNVRDVWVNDEKRRGIVNEIVKKAVSVSYCNQNVLRVWILSGVSVVEKVSVWKQYNNGIEGSCENENIEILDCLLNLIEGVYEINEEELEMEWIVEAERVCGEVMKNDGAREELRVLKLIGRSGFIIGKSRGLIFDKVRYCEAIEAAKICADWFEISGEAYDKVSDGCISKEIVSRSHRLHGYYAHKGGLEKRGREAMKRALRATPDSIKTLNCYAILLGDGCVCGEDGDEDEEDNERKGISILEQIVAAEERGELDGEEQRAEVARTWEILVGMLGVDGVSVLPALFAFMNRRYSSLGVGVEAGVAGVAGDAVKVTSRGRAEGKGKGQGKAGALTRGFVCLPWVRGGSKDREGDARIAKATPIATATVNTATVNTGVADEIGYLWLSVYTLFTQNGNSPNTNTNSNSQLAKQEMARWWSRARAEAEIETTTTNSTNSTNSIRFAFSADTALAALVGDKAGVKADSHLYKISVHGWRNVELQFRDVL